MECRETRRRSVDHNLKEIKRNEKELPQSKPETARRIEAESGENAPNVPEREATKGTGENITDGNGVQFRSRKRARKTRVRRALDSDKDGTDEKDGGDETSRSELLLMREAQRLRERNRNMALDIRAAKKDQLAGQKAAKHGDQSDDNVVGGLKEDFAVERSGHAIEERMEKYIKERMRRKFGDKEDTSDASGAEAKPSAENDLFAIPDRLKVEERPLYDPGEGLPAAGVEEVELPEEVRQKNIQETVRAHKEFLAKRESRDRTQSVEDLPGNLSANYMKHKKDWIAEHLGPNHNGSQNRGNAPSRDLGSDSKDARDYTKPEATKRPRYQAATDSFIADRFRKRWRR